MARRQRHLRNVRRVPSRHDRAARIWIALQQRNNICDLIDDAAVRRLPAPPLLAIHGTEITARIGPLIPDLDAVILQITNVGIAGEEPDQLVDDRLHVQLLGRDQRKALRQIKPHLTPEHA